MHDKTYLQRRPLLTQTAGMAQHKYTRILCTHTSYTHAHMHKTSAPQTLVTAQKMHACFSSRSRRYGNIGSIFELDDDYFMKFKGAYAVSYLATDHDVFKKNDKRKLEYTA